MTKTKIGEVLDVDVLVASDGGIWIGNDEPQCIVLPMESVETFCKQLTELCDTPQRRIRSKLKMLLDEDKRVYPKKVLEDILAEVSK